MSYVVRCIDGSCSEGYTLSDFETAKHAAQEHISENKQHIMVIHDTDSECFYQVCESGTWRLRDSDYAQRRYD